MQEGRVITVLGEGGTILATVHGDALENYGQLLDIVTAQLGLDKAHVALKTRDILPDTLPVTEDVVQIVSVKDRPLDRQKRLAFASEQALYIVRKEEFKPQPDKITILLQEYNKILTMVPSQGRITWGSLKRVMYGLPQNANFFGDAGLMDDYQWVYPGDFIMQI